MNIDDRIQWLTDRELVSDLPLRYALGLDTRRFADARAVFRDDATVSGTVRTDAIDPYFEYLEEAVSRYQATMHFMGNQYVDIVSGADSGQIETYAVAYHLEEPTSGRPDLIMGVRYQDAVARAGEGWLITARTVVPQWIRGPVQGSEGGSKVDDAHSREKKEVEA